MFFECISLYFIFNFKLFLIISSFSPGDIGGLPNFSPGAFGQSDDHLLLFELLRPLYKKFYIFSKTPNECFRFGLLDYPDNVGRHILSERGCHIFECTTMPSFISRADIHRFIVTKEVDITGIVLPTNPPRTTVLRIDQNFLPEMQEFNVVDSQVWDEQTVIEWENQLMGPVDVRCDSCDDMRKLPFSTVPILVASAAPLVSVNCDDVPSVDAQGGEEDMDAQGGEEDMDAQGEEEDVEDRIEEEDVEDRIEELETDREDLDLEGGAEGVERDEELEAETSSDEDFVPGNTFEVTMENNIPASVRYDKTAFMYAKMSGHYRPILLNNNPKQILVVESRGQYWVADGTADVTKNLPRNLPASRRIRVQNDLHDFLSDNM